MPSLFFFSVIHTIRRNYRVCAIAAIMFSPTALLLPEMAFAQTKQQTQAIELRSKQIVDCPAGNHVRGKKPPAGTEWQCLDANDQPDGLWLTWYGNGQLMSERHMKHGKEHGMQRSWWPNGQLMMEGVSYQGGRYKGFKYWSITGAPTELNLETETITKKADGSNPTTPAQTITPTGTITPQQNSTQPDTTKSPAK